MGDAFVLFSFAASDNAALSDGDGFFTSGTLGLPALFNQLAKSGFNFIFSFLIHSSIFRYVIIGA